MRKLLTRHNSRRCLYKYPHWLRSWRREKRSRKKSVQLKINLTKSFLGVSSGKFLGFIITSKGIHLDSDKVKAIQSMYPPKNLKELRGLQGRLAYIGRFIANLSGRCQPFTRLMKKGVSFVWDQACQEVYEDIKRYLTKPPVLVAPTSGKPFLLYVKAMDHSLGALLA